MVRIVAVLRLLAIFFGFDILLLLLFAAGPELMAKGLNGDSDAWLPIIRHDPTPTAVPTPQLPPSPYEAQLLITPTGGINASTFNRDSFILRNKASNGQKMTFVSIDLSTAVFPDMIFDPYGRGGDTLAKDLKVDEKGGTGFAGPRYDGERGGGYDTLELNFQEFEPGEEFRFSVDVDPNSIRGVGAPGPNESGSVSGLELLGSTVTVRFEDGHELVNRTFLIPGSDSGSQAVLREGLPLAPQLSLRGIEMTPAETASAAQIAIISGGDWQPASLVVLEGGLFLDGVPGGGYNVKPYNANSLVAFQVYDAQSFHGGYTEVPVRLMRSMPEGGINYLTAALDNNFGNQGPPSAALKLVLTP